MGYRIFIDGVELPVTTDKLSAKQELSSTEYDILGVGKVQVPQGQGLRTVEFQTEFPGQRRGYVTGEWEEPQRLLARFRGLQREKKRVRFVSVGENEDKTTLPVTLESLTVEEIATEGGDYTVSFRLKEYREYGAVLTQVEHLPRPGVVPMPESVVVKSGQTLQDSLKNIKQNALKNVPTNVMETYTLQQAAKVGGALAPVVNPMMAKENKPLYLSPGQADFAASKTTKTIQAEQWGVDLGNALHDTGTAVKSVAGNVWKGIQDAWDLIPK